MPYATGDDLIRARRVWQWVLAFVAVGQGLQYALNPAFPIASASYAVLSNEWHETGWLLFGAVLSLSGVAMVLLPVGYRWVAHFLAAFCYLLLGAAQAVSLTFPFLLFLAVASHVGELVLTRIQWNRRAVNVPPREAG